MNLKTAVIGLALAVGTCATAQADKLYKWVDDDGVVHYGDSVPATDARRERSVLNEQGVQVDVLPRQKTRAELAAEAEAERQVQAQVEREQRARERDRILLDTYLSVEEIADLRDRRILALEAQIGVTRHYMNNLKGKWEELEAEARRYNFPYSDDSDLPALPDDIAQHLIHTERAMAEHVQTVRTLREEQGNIRDEFQRDMDRFKELKADRTAGSVSTSGQF
ncbi:MAG: DUF4124 domain-containing protein [Gammaproteobacteria bacterium]